jgi:hypothetical protein
VKHPFQLEWLGGKTERYFRKVRPGIDELPWGTLEPGRYPPLLVDRARVSWTEAAYNEYTTAVAFAQLVQALLEARAPIDLVAMAGDFVADELLHVELTSRIAMELGGGAPYSIDFEALAQPVDPTLPPRERASELVVRICCVGEAFSLPMLSGCQRSALHPLTSAVLDRIVRDEAPHGQLGWLYLDWAADDMADAERVRLAAVALEMVQAFEPYWRRLRSQTRQGVTSEGFSIEHVRELGWMESPAYAAAAREAMRDRVMAPLSRYGIALDEQACEALLS